MEKYKSGRPQRRNERSHALKNRLSAKSSFILVLTMLCLLLLTWFAASAVTGSTIPRAAIGTSVVSLGSSYAVGNGLSQSFGQILSGLLAQRSGRPAKYTNLARPGSNVTDITTFQASHLPGQKYDVVVVTAGGNDLNYVGCLMNPNANFCGATIDENAYIQRFTAALDSIVKYLPNPTSTPVYIVDYTQAIGSSSACGLGRNNCPLSPDQVKRARATYDKVVDWTYRAVINWQGANRGKGYNVRRINMRSFSANTHDFDSSTPWINGAIGRDSSGDGSGWHPNEAGAHFMAQAIFNDLTSRYYW